LPFFGFSIWGVFCVNVLNCLWCNTMTWWQWPVVTCQAFQLSVEFQLHLVNFPTW
jgi:hypothetical protein